MHSSNIKEELSISYISAVSSHAGIAYDTQRHDDDSTDGILKKLIELDGGRKYSASLRIQLKATSSASQYEDCGDYIKYKLKVKNFNDLCRRSTTPIMLGLLILPEEERDWVNWSEEALLIKGVMYWAEFSGQNESSNKEMVTIEVDKKHIINSDTLQALLEKIAKEEWP